VATEAVIGFGKRHRGLFVGPVLEIGSLIDPSYKQFLPRSIHNPIPDEYVGIDIFDGEGVDRVLNLCLDNQVPAEWTSNGGYFKTVHCHDVMEHVTDIFSMARNIDRITRVGGAFCISVPFVWKIHRIPIDMWRFTPQSIDYLFPNFEFKKEHCGWSTRKNDYYEIDDYPELNLAKGSGNVNPLFRLFIRGFRKLKLENGFFSYRALMPEMNLMMIGIKRNEPVYTFINRNLI
jgi:hypothetical protein